MFCFIDQLPPGRRAPLYFKDDDERLSFLFGNYITLTNLTDHEIDRIIQTAHQPDLRLGTHHQPGAAGADAGQQTRRRGIKCLPKPATGGIELNRQPNCLPRHQRWRRAAPHIDRPAGAAPPGGQYRRLRPPASLTDRDKLYKLTPYDKESAAATLDILEASSIERRAEYGRSVICTQLTNGT